MSLLQLNKPNEQNPLFAFDKQFSLPHESEGSFILAGVDEAGRGPLAGPVVAAAVSFSAHHTPIYGVKDSKKISEKKREELFALITASASAWGVGIKDHKVIDAINIRQASLAAMKDALKRLQIEPTLTLVDGRDTIPAYLYPQQAVIGGDRTSYCIAAASIIAKVIRDRIMHHFHTRYPHYQFNRHKGYGTKLHREALREHGSSPIHRLSFKQGG